MKKSSLSVLIACSFSVHAYDQINYVAVTDPGLFTDTKVSIRVETFLTTSAKPTVILAHACGGDTAAGQTEWAERIRSWGYNVVKPDSFRPRGIDRDCGGHRMITWEQRARDFGAVADWASTQTWHKGNIAIVGFSHGAVGGIEYANKPTSNKITAIVAYYPKCGIGGQSKPKIPVQMHIAGSDDWTLPGPCISLAEDNDMYDGWVYPSATHVFDRVLSITHYQGHKVGFDPVAAPQAEQNTQRFLKQHLN